MAATLRTEYTADGKILHLVPHPPGRLPAVTKRDLEQAWEVARATALSSGPPPATHGFRFHNGGEAPLDFVLNDRDAASWAGGIDGVANLSTAHGVSVCLRLMALVELMSRASWTRPWFTLNRAGLTFHPALLTAAALTPLTETGGFAETALRALLPQPDRGVLSE
jgi:hypothetical protein